MRNENSAELFSRAMVTALVSLLFAVPAVEAQNSANSSECQPSPQSCDVRELTAIVRELKQQVASLSSQVEELRSEQESGRPHSSQASPTAGQGDSSSASGAASTQTGSLPSTGLSGENAQPQTIEQRVSQLEENQQLTANNLSELSQTKVESGSKYRLRFSGIVLLNLFENRGQVDSVDLPEIATPANGFESGGAFGGSLRQSQIRIDAFGPDIAGAHTSANLTFDFAGGFPNTPNGSTMGIVRLRTGTIRMDWGSTSLIAGQDPLFFTPLEPTSMASLALPALSYAGELWSWTPQVRVEHRFGVTEHSSVLVQGGILDSLSGDLPVSEYENYPSWGEESGQPGYAARVAWQHSLFGQDVVLGAGGYYGKQYWGFGRNVDGWASTFDAIIPLGQQFEFTAQFFRGKALGGLGGGIGQDVLFTTTFTDPASDVDGLDSMGGWGQLKWKWKPNFEVNGAWGIDNPFASELHEYPLTQSYYGPLLSKNWSAFANFIYHPRSDVVLSLEYRYLQTFVFGGPAPSAHHINASFGYLF